MLSGSHCASKSQSRSPSSREYGTTNHASSGDEGGRIQRSVSLDGRLFMTTEIETEMALIRGGAVVCCFVVRHPRTSKDIRVHVRVREQGSGHKRRIIFRKSLAAFACSASPMHLPLRSLEIKILIKTRLFGTRRHRGNPRFTAPS